MTTTTNTARLTKGDYQTYLQQGISYQQYKQNMSEDLALNKDLKIKEYINLNQRRMHRVEKTYIPSAQIITQVKNLKHKTYWLILTEHWCGDASQSLPALHALAELSEGKIEMKLMYRDQNNELMNAYLTNGTRSIPKLVQLDEHFNVTGIWGPRPTVAQKLVKELKANPATASSYANELHLWYAKDKQQNLEKETAQLLFRANLYCPDCLS
ncbi:thioredoxin family protein [Lacibacter sp. MH-610]|uniref:thioredoxin family protein n=1 Tax=Lacibacter sp. MH-610 TaxID=3020883 RepID=UPI003892B4DD